MIKPTIKFLKSSKRFERPLFLSGNSHAPSTSVKEPYYFFLKFLIIFQFVRAAPIVSVTLK